MKKENIPLEVNHELELYPKFISYNTQVGHTVGLCLCGNYVKDRHNFCYNCGIKLNWSKLSEYSEMLEK